MNNSTSEIQLSRKALANNFRFLKKEFGKNVRISSVLKGNAYGHGIKEMVPLILENGISYLSVFSDDEAWKVKQAAASGYDLMIMGMVENDGLEWAIREGVEFFVFDAGRLEESVKIAKKNKLKAKIHIELETGMNRSGFPRKDLNKVLPFLRKHKQYIEFKGLCTHYAGAESIANYIRVEKQIANFRSGLDSLNKKDCNPEMLHTACSAAAMAYPETRMDMVRIGIMQYGLWPGPEIFIHYIGKKKSRLDPLQPVISWKTKVMSLKEVSTGEFIGYGTSYLARDYTKIAVIPVGYAHGYNRSLSNVGRVLIRGNRVGVVGMVNMNMILVNVTDVPDVEKGDEVVLIGRQGDQSVSVSSFSEYSDQLNYELLSRLPENIRRVVVD